MSNICNKSVTDRLLGCLIKQPNLCLDSRYKLTSEEFEYTSKFSAIMFVVINNLASNGTQTITLLDVNAFLEPYEAQYNIYKDNNGDDYISLISSITAEDNFESYYNEFKKLSLLNTYYMNKFDISKFWDFEKSDDKNYEILNQYSIKDIIDSYDAVQESVKLNYSSSILKQLKCGDGFEDVKELFKETPYFGAVMESPIQTTLYRGWCRGHLLLRSAPSGFGKSILAVGELCNVCATEVYDYKKETFVSNPNYQGCGGLFINTEMDLETELVPMFVAYVSGVSRGSIMDGKYDYGEEARVDKAIEILHDSNIYLVDDPKFTLNSLENTIKDHVLNHDVGYVIMDYLQDNGIIGKEMHKTHEVIARDTIILNLAEELKTWARLYNIGIYTSTQLNGNEKVNDIIDEACLSGGKAVKNKIDAGNIIMYPKKKELEVFEKIDNRIGFNNVQPNIVSHNYKIRFGKYGTNLKILQYADLGTGRVTDLCCLNVLNQPVDVERTVTADE